MQAGNPPLRADEQVRLLPAVRDGDEGRLGRLVLEAQRSAYVRTVHDDLTQHGHHRSGGMVGGGGAGFQAAHELLRRQGAQAFGRPVGEDVELEAGADQLLVEIHWGLLGRRQDVPGGVVHRPPLTPRLRGPLVVGQARQGPSQVGAFAVNHLPCVLGAHVVPFAQKSSYVCSTRTLPAHRRTGCGTRLLARPKSHHTALRAFRTGSFRTGLFRAGLWLATSTLLFWRSEWILRHNDDRRSRYRQTASFPFEACPRRYEGLSGGRPSQRAKRHVASAPPGRRARSASRWPTGTGFPAGSLPAQVRAAMLRGVREHSPHLWPARLGTPEANHPT